MSFCFDFFGRRGFIDHVQLPMSIEGYFSAIPYTGVSFFGKSGVGSIFKAYTEHRVPSLTFLFIYIQTAF